MLTLNSNNTPAHTFTPEDSCLSKIIALCRNTLCNIDVCIFTISDGKLSNKLIAARRRAIEDRIISDNEKQHNASSDIQKLQEAKITLHTDKSEYHMHHKFAIFDRKFYLMEALTGLYQPVLIVKKISSRQIIQL